MSGHSTSATPTVKPERPTGSPIFWHASSRWAKKIRGKFDYIGGGFHGEAPAEHNRRGPVTAYILCARFLTAKKDQRDQRDQGELSERMFAEYGDVCKRVLKAFRKGRVVIDLRPADFAALRKKMGI